MENNKKKQKLPKIYWLEVSFEHSDQDYFGLPFVKMMKIYKQVRSKAIQVNRYVAKNGEWVFDTKMK